jgi:hypothetical protein
MYGNERSLFDAYKRAWRVRKSSGDTREGVLRDEFSRTIPASRSDDLREQMEVMVSLWNQGVKPSRVRASLFRGAVHAFLNPWLATMNESNTSSDQWMAIPESIGRVSARYHEQAVIEQFAIRPIPTASDIFSDARDAPLDPEGWHCAPVWLRPSPDPSAVDVLIGREVVGHATVLPNLWELLRGQAAEGFFADGELRLRTLETGEIVLGDMKCALPPGA